MVLSQRLTEHLRLSEHEEMILHYVAISMLSFYSDPTLQKTISPCFSFDEVSTLLAVLPAIRDIDCITAVLSLSSYICQFFLDDQYPGMTTARSSLCATPSLITFVLFQIIEEDSSSCSPSLIMRSTQLELVCNTIGCIAKHDSSSATSILQAITSYFLCNTLTQIYKTLPSHSLPLQFMLMLTDNVFTLLITCLSSNRTLTLLFDELRLSTLPSIVADFVQLDATTPEVLAAVVRYYYAISLSEDLTFAHESLPFLFENITRFLHSRRYRKVKVVFEAMTLIFESNAEVALVWENIKGFDASVSILNTLTSFSHSANGNDIF